jgi:hypothetical protein
MIVTRRVTRDLPRYEVVNGIPIYRVSPAIHSPRARWLMIISTFPTLIRQRKNYDLILVPGFRTLGITAVLIGMMFKNKVVLKAENRGEVSGVFFSGGLKQIGLMKTTSWGVRGLMGLGNRLLMKAEAWVSVSREMTEDYLQAGLPSARIPAVRLINFAPNSPDAISLINAVF